ncbi:MAG: transposase [Verrucomicrobiota bacterium]
MPARLVNIDRDTPMLLPPDLRDWVAEDDPARLIIDLIENLDLTNARIKTRGSGSKQYPPSMMLALLLYSYSHGVYSSRQIESLTHNHVGVRYICAGLHPDHDTICSFRRKNKALIIESFGQSLRLAGELAILSIGSLQVAADGTKIASQGSKRATLSVKQINDELKELRGEKRLIQTQIRQLLKEAEATDQREKDLPNPVPEDLLAPKGRSEKMKQALEAIRKKERRETKLEAARNTLTQRQ